MPRAIKIAAIVGALLVAVVAAQIIASESGEVVVLGTTEATGEVKETRVWIVEQDGQLWLRSGSPTSTWYLRLLANPQISIERDGHLERAIAAPDPARQTSINQLMRAKYGWADVLIGLMHGRDDAIAIQLIRIPDPDSA